jgi:hypothetical protein
MPEQKMIAKPFIGHSTATANILPTSENICPTSKF